MAGCCPAEAALALAGPEAAGRPARAGALEQAAREIRPGVALLQLMAPGMHCGGCVATLERALSRAPGVRAARANLTAKRLSIEYAPAETTAAAVADVAEAAGFAVHPALDADSAARAEAAETRDLLARMGVAGFAAMNVMLLSVSIWSGADAATRDLMHWISALIALPVVVYSGRPFFVSALKGLRAGRLNMDAPISLAVILAACVSVYETAHGGAEAFFDAAVMLLFLLLVGRYLDRLMRARARSAAAGLMALQPRGAVVRGADGAAWTALEAIRPGDVTVVAPGERVAVDGVVVEGASDLDASWLTGESAPETAAPGAAVRAGAMNLSGPLAVRATAVGERSSLGEVAALMAEAESRKSRIARLADKAAAVYAPVVHLVALGAFLWWIGDGATVREAAFVAIATLIITCPCALGLAAPMAQATAAGALFRRGVMLRDGAALERLALVDRAVFDKTGTLTEGRPAMRAPGAAAGAALPLAAALAGGSRHPLAQALAAAARAAGVVPGRVDEVREVPGYGVEARTGGETVRLGRAAWVGAGEAEAVEAAEASAVWLSRPGAAPVAYLFDDAPRSGAVEAVARLEAAGLRVSILSGDRPGPVAALAARLGVSDWRAQAGPQDKIAALAAMNAEGARTLMVGDGINDAPALAEASVSIAPASAADIGRAAADIVLVGEDLRAVAEAHALARRTRAVILQNFAIAAAYNCVAIPLAVTGHASPLVAAIAMSSSSILVVANALRLAGGGPRTAPGRGARLPQAAEAAA
ncbi:heavy metal translocating P-type ATPase [Rubrimonas cliftonensis]|uniref:Cu2+-exporting ATPase n=1 Tax=Rubrimonas cliftonensis TaxID=89524 RepID=A0A1H4DND2_9RHOB|nr:heavy metal translocating P-type ATPase [Rubrimonas cliftonensis]SEA74019.1 Cu2+-exporting ATPase [Rubrimonas cliftonensis]